MRVPGPLTENRALSCYLFVSLLRSGLELLRILQLLFQFLDLLLEEVSLVFAVHGLFLDNKMKTGISLISVIKVEAEVTFKMNVSME